MNIKLQESIFFNSGTVPLEQPLYPSSPILMLWFDSTKLEPWTHTQIDSYTQPRQQQQQQQQQQHIIIMIIIMIITTNNNNVYRVN